MANQGLGQFRIRFYVDFDWVPGGTGGTMDGSLQANNPGAGSVGAAQTLRLQQLEYVPGGDTPSQANFNTALAQGATDLETQVATVLAQMQAWKTGGY